MTADKVFLNPFFSRYAKKVGTKQKRVNYAFQYRFQARQSPAIARTNLNNRRNIFKMSDGV